MYINSSCNIHLITKEGLSRQNWSGRPVLARINLGVTGPFQTVESMVCKLKMRCLGLLGLAISVRQTNDKMSIN